MRDRLFGMKKYVPGMTLISLGVLIVAFPVLLVVFASSFLVLTGILAITIAYKFRHLEERMNFQFTSRNIEKPFWFRAPRDFDNHSKPW